jgi:hypothetical protein
VFASCEGIADEWFTHFDTVVPSMGEHAGKLNLLAAEIAQVAEPDDLLMFLDGDAFPIADPMPVVWPRLERAPLVAIRRSEALGQSQPHPAFCVTSVGTWTAIRGDWSRGHPWEGDLGQLTDVGGNLLRALERNGMPWEPLLRSNTVNPHPVWFGVYGSIVYHHGAGFRYPLTHEEKLSIAAREAALLRKVPGVGRRINKRMRSRYRRKLLAARERHSGEVFDALTRDPEFWKRFVE